MKKIYCKYCGLELEKGSCSCEQFLATKNFKINQNKVCDTCGKINDEDAVYCVYCGLPLDVNGNIKALQKELRGENALDVLEVYRKEDKRRGIKNSKVKKSKLTLLMSSAIVLSMMAIIFFTFAFPIVKKMIADYELKKELETAAIHDELMLTPTEERTMVETSQPVIDLKDKWVKNDGYFYAFDKDGDPVVDDWVTETDENGEEQKYYFDIDGRLVVNSWIDGEYYVGSDGAMLKNQETPDGAFVDEDGRVLLQLGEGVPVTKETYVYYEYPGASETIAASTMKSKISGEIKGVDPDKKYELYIKNIRQEKATATKGDLKCNITFYIPIIDGADEREVRWINEAFDACTEEFREDLIKVANGSRELPKSIVFNVVEQRNLNSNRMVILTHGKLNPRKGLTEKRKFRFVYDRKSKKIVVRDITE